MLSTTLSVVIPWYAVAAAPLAGPFLWIGAKQAKKIFKKWQKPRFPIKAPIKSALVESTQDHQDYDDPSAFWNWPDWSGGANLADPGAQPFWMLPPKMPDNSATQSTIAEPEIRLSFESLSSARRMARQVTEGLQSSTLTAVRGWLLASGRSEYAELGSVYIKKNTDTTWLVCYTRTDMLEKHVLGQQVKKFITPSPATYEMSDATLQQIIGDYG